MLYECGKVFRSVMTKVCIRVAVAARDPESEFGGLGKRSSKGFRKNSKIVEF